ncbi:hypothetical protein DB88DRAFT_493849 [Papiliotrema laurentii]|uniref:Ribose 5-phosphate isomerase n=1 Tax=Papiliotrema laurentii TaxID=5418 RepID=A0AAD9D1K1_PAPLA|nr:hypothetical protein DB88DRAFT_493849 [Papiliotrema laurentii]
MSPSYTIVMGCDNAGCEYKTALKADLEKDPRVKAVIDVGVNKGQEDYDTAYPHIGVAVGRTIAEGKADRGLLICGTGMGVAMAANKVPGIRASTAHDSFSVERLIKSNNAQVLCLGQRVIGLEVARKLVSEWLGHEFDETSASAEKVKVLLDYEKETGVREEDVPKC